MLDPCDAIGQVNQNVRLAAGAAQLEVEVVSTLFGTAIAPKAEEAAAVDKASLSSDLNFAR